MTRLLFLAAGAALLALTPAPARETGDALEAGFGEADVTPKLGDKPVYMAGFGQNRKATRVHDPLTARAVVLRHGGTKLALVSVDAIGLFRPLVVRVREQLPGFTYVLVSSTHVHEGPDTLGLWGPSPVRSGVDPDYLRFVEGQIVKAVRAADEGRKPVTARIGSVKLPDLLHDAREPYVKHDELVALEFLDKSGAPAGVVVQWNCHPETVDSKSTEITSDFVGHTVGYLRERFRCPAVYFTGTVGGLMTSMHVDVKGPDGKVLPEGSFAKTERFGRLLGEAAEAALKSGGPVRLTPLEARHRRVFLPLDNKQYLLARQLGVLDREAFRWSGDPDKAEPLKAGENAKALCTETELGWLRLGELDVAAVPGEIYPELVLGKVQDPVDPGADFPDAPVEPALYAQLRGKHKMLIGLANDEVGYILPKRQWDEKPPYCYGRKKPQYGEGNSLGSETGPLLCAAFKALIAGSK
jgi:hypothetical protein